MLDASAAYQGLHWPAEFYPHDATWVSWPRNSDTWPRNLQQTQAEHAQFVRTIADHERVYVLAGGDAWKSASAALSDHPNIELVDVPTNDAWARDHAPTFVLDAEQRLVAVNWIYTAWGGKYPPYDNDQEAGRAIARHLNCGLVRSNKVFEGGAIETNGEGLLLTTRSCALDPNRNPDVTESSFEAEFRALLGVDRIVWLPGDPIIGDDTDGHIDQIARFVDAKRVLVAVQRETDDPNHLPLKGNWDALQQWNEQQQAGLELIELPMPGVVQVYDVRLPASYANFYIANSLVVVPAFGDPQDDHAVGILQDLFPKREVVACPARHLVVGLGSIHCMTQQQPAQV